MSTRMEQAMKTTAFNEKGLTPLPWDQPDSSINLLTRIPAPAPINIQLLLPNIHPAPAHTKTLTPL